MCHQQVKWLQSEDEKGVILGNLLLRGQQSTLTAIWKHYWMCVLAFVMFVPQEECWKCCSFMAVPDHTCLHTTTTITEFGWQWFSTHPTVLTLHHLWWLATLCMWWGTAECFMPMAAQERKQPLCGGNTCSCSKVEEELAALEIILENTYISSNAVVKLPEIFVCLTWEWHETKKKGITFWLTLVCC